MRIPLFKRQNFTDSIDIHRVLLQEIGSTEVSISGSSAETGDAGDKL
jgi:hypothetical protein